MAFDASALWWPPFQKLYTQLETLKLEPGGVPADALRATLAEYEPWLARGVAGFGRPCEASRRAVQGDAPLAIGAKKLPVEAGLRGAAADVSASLELDEVQAYVLLRRWAAKAGPAALARPPGAPGPAPLSAAQRLEVARLYHSERLYLLKSVESLLWEGERAVGGPLLDVIEGALGALLEKGLEDAAVEALRHNLDGPAAGGAPPQPPAPGPPGSGAPGGAGLAEARAHAAAVERCALLHILILVYYHPRKQCTPDRFLSLAALFHARLFAAPPPAPPAGAAAELSPAQLSVKLATVLLLEVLDVDKALAAVAAGQPLDAPAGGYAFAEPGVRARVNTELAGWRPVAPAAHSPVLLAWAAVLCLAERSAAEGGASAAGGGEFAPHAARAHESGALDALRQLTEHVGLQADAAEMLNNITMSTLSAALCAFDFSPAALAAPQLEAVVGAAANLFRGQPALCDGFWQGDRAADEPLRALLDDLRGLFPALPAPLYRLLTALCASADSAVAATAYLAQLPGLACLHVLPDPALEEGCNEEGELYAREPLPLPGARALSLPQGVLGEPAPLPEGLSPADGLWTAAGADELERAALVRWRLALPEGVGPLILLARLTEALAVVQAAPPGPGAAPGAAGRAAGALAELSAALALLAAVCGRDPDTAAELLRVEVPEGGADAEGGGARGADLLAVACQAAAVLSALPEPPTDAVADCFAICAALAEACPGRVASEVLSLCGVGPTAAAAAAGRGTAQEPDAPLLRRLLAAECARGRYPATRALLRLLIALVSVASPAPSLRVLVVWVLHRVLAEHRGWRYVLRAERWRLAALALRLVRQSLLSAPAAAGGGGGGGGGGPEGGEGSAVAEAVAGVLRYDVGMAACLLAALPHHAEQLERAGAEARGEDEVVAVEGACIEWHRLLPVLLPAGAPDARLAPAAFFRPCGGAAGGDGGGASAAAVLLSYLTYPYFGSLERALVVRSLHCLAAAAADTAPGAVFAVLLPQEPGGGGVSAAARAALAAALTPAAAAATPALLAGACDALAAAVRCHPSLLDALLFPSGLEQALLDKENASANAAPALPTPGGAKPGDGRPGEGRGGRRGAPRSCLDALWELLEGREALAAEHPAALAKLLHVLAAFWQWSGSTFRAVAVLRRQPGLWAHLAGVLRGGAAAEPPALPAPVGAGADAAAAAWAGGEPAAALLAAEASAAQILAAEAHAWGGGEGAPAELASLLRALPGELAPRLLLRYAAPQPTAAVVRGAQRAATAAGLALLGAALSDEALWRSAADGPALVPRLAAAAQPLLRQCASQADAAALLCEAAPRLAAANFPARPAAVAICDLVLRQAEAPGRLAADREPGRAFVYDAPLLRRRLGVLAGHAEAVGQLAGWLEAASVAASLEDARLAAAAALRSLLSVAREAGGGGGAAADVPAAAVQSAVGVVRDSIEELAAAARDGAAEGAAAAAEAAAVDVVGARLSGTAEAAAVLLLLAQRWAAGGAAGGEAAAAELAGGVLQATGDWLETQQGCDVAALSASPDAALAADSLTGSLLAAALVLLPAAPATNAEAAPPRPEAQRLQAAAAALLPALLAGCHRQPPQLLLLLSLATALMERLVPPAAWLPLVRAQLHFGTLLQSMLGCLHTAAQAAAAARAAAAAHAGTPPPLPLPGPAAPAAADGGVGGGGAPGPLAAASVEEAALLLALQVAQSPAGAQLLVEQQAAAEALALGTWLLAPEGGDLMGETPAGGAPVVDYSNAYRQDGSPNPTHRLWCCVASLLAALLAALPGHAAVEQAALRLAVAGEPRLLLAVEPPAGGGGQPLTLAMAQEGRYSLFLLCGLARLAGQWRLTLPDSPPAFRRATAAFLDFCAAPAAGAAACAPVSAAERAAARADAASDAAPRLDRGWFGAVAAAARGGGGGGGGGAAAAAPGGYAWQLAERLYSGAQYALAFQLALAPEVGEEEVASLGPEWVRPDTLLALQRDALEVAEALLAAGAPRAPRLARTLQALLGLSTELQDSLGAERPHSHRRAVAAAIERLGGGGRR